MGQEAELERQYLYDHLVELLTQVAMKMDANGNGLLSRAETKNFISDHPQILDRLAALGINITADEWLDLMDDMVTKAEDESHKHLDHDTVEFPIESVVKVIMHAEGNATAANAMMLKHEILDLHKKIKQVEIEIEQSRKSAGRRAGVIVRKKLDQFERQAAAFERKMDISYLRLMQQLDRVDKSIQTSQMQTSQTL